MPCRDDYPVADYENDKLRKRIDELAQMLCGLCRVVEDQTSYGDLIERVVGLPEWWADHKKADAKRRKEEKRQREVEKTIAKAMNKLSKKEQRLLGLIDEEAPKKRKGKKS